MAKNDTKNQNTDPMSNRPDYIGQQDINMPIDEQARFPRLKLIQALSPERTKGNEKYIPGLEDGSLVLQSETATRIIDGEEGIVVIPLAVRKRFVEYVPRDAGGGFVAMYDTKEQADMDRDPENDLQTTIEFLCIEAGAEEPTPFTITFDSVSKLGVAKKWAGFIAMYKTLDGVKYLVTGKQQLNKKKQAYYVFNIQPVGWVDKAQHALVQDLSKTMEPLFLTHTDTEDGEI